MLNRLMIFIIYLICCATACFGKTHQKETYFALEHPKIVYLNPKQVSFYNMSSYRHSRKDPVYYLNIHFGIKVPVGNNFSVHFYIYQFLTNMYKPSFVEVHQKVCNLIFVDRIFSDAFKKALQKTNPNFTCPLPPGNYNLQNITFSTRLVPNFPFSRGRTYINVTTSPPEELVSAAYIDFAIKEIRVRN